MPVSIVGNAHIHRVEELRIPNTIAHFTRDRELIEANRHWLAPHFLDANDSFDLVFQSFIFEVDGRVVLVDPCTGNGRPHPIHFFDNLDIPFIERMSETGYGPEDIDFVVCTHLHHDHCGWNTRLRDGKWVPTFPNARYILRREEYERWGANRHLHPVKHYNEGVFERSVLPVYEAGLADLVVGAHRLTSDAVVEPAPGHTIGHQTLHITSQGMHAIFTGDCFHHPIQLVEPSLPFGDSENMEQTVAIRLQLKQRAADLDALLIPAHLCAPYALKVRREKGGFQISAAFARNK